MNEFYKIDVNINDPSVTLISEKCSDITVNTLLEKNVIGYITKGKKRIIGLGEICEGDVYLMPIGDYFINYSPDKNNIYEEILISFNSNDIFKIINSLSYNFNISDYLSNNDTIYIPHCIREKCNPISHEIFVHIQNLQKTYKETDAKIKDILTQVCIYKLVASFISQHESLIRDRLIKLLRKDNTNLHLVVSKALNKSSNIDDMAKDCGVSIAQFKKIFSELYGTTPHKWIIEYQMRKASVLLENSDKMVSEIAVACNFKDSSHLIKHFKSHFNTTPSNYRRNIRRKNEERYRFEQKL